MRGMQYLGKASYVFASLRYRRAEEPWKHSDGLFVIWCRFGVVVRMVTAGEALNVRMILNFTGWGGVWGGGGFNLLNNGLEPK